MELPEFLARNEHGDVTCAGHRIALFDIVYFFNEGCSAEMIASQFPTLPLSLIYKSIGFYLDHRAEVDRQMSREQEQTERQRRASSPGPPVDELRQRLTQLHQLEFS